MRINSKKMPPFFTTTDDIVQSFKSRGILHQGIGSMTCVRGIFFSGVKIFRITEIIEVR
jgi:hypothetical protein